MKILEYIKDRYLTWRTGKDKSQREWEAWYDINVIYCARDITNMFENFEHVIEVRWDNFFDHEEMGAWIPNEDAKQYFWPARELGNNAVWRIERVLWDRWDNRWHITGLGGEDKVFVATNNSKDAMMMALKYS